ncbi:Uncharacterized protein GBIM_02399 [Gryllus bimaculatus]|nr:Uncharacterized protein GBIM_02399 [Gryllus bimaculatus]
MFAGRIHYVGCIFMTTLLASVIIPVIMHWMWTSTGWLNKATFIQNYVSYKDHGGGMLIHVCGGIVAFIGSLFLGRRLFRLEDIDGGFLTPESPASATVGYILVIYGLMAVCLPTPVYEVTHEPMNYIGLIFINNILAAAGGIITVVVLQFFFSGNLLLQYWTMLRYMQGAVAGIVTIAPGVDVYTPYVALGLGISGGILFYVIAYFMFYSALEDYANIIAAHLSCGFLGSLLPPLCGSREGFGVPHKIIIHFGWQVIGGLVISVTMIVLTVLIFFLMKILHFLRTEEDDICHQRAMATLSRGPGRKCFERLWDLKPESFFMQPGCKAHKNINKKGIDASENKA